MMFLVLGLLGSSDVGTGVNCQATQDLGDTALASSPCLPQPGSPQGHSPAWPGTQSNPHLFPKMAQWALLVPFKQLAVPVHTHPQASWLLLLGSLCLPLKRDWLKCKLQHTLFPEAFPTSCLQHAAKAHPAIGT